MIRHGLVLAAGFAMIAPVAVHAQEVLMRVKPGPKRHFYTNQSDRDGCPALTVACRRSGYLLPGDPVVAGKVRGKFTWVTFVASGGKPTSGWMESAALVRVPPPPPRAQSWVGTWYGWNGAIDITPSRRADRLHVEGVASWGGHDPDRVARGAINMGDFEDELTPEGDMLFYPDGAGPVDPDASPDGDCRIQMKLLGPYLSVSDQGQCGGLNVTFTGVYRK